MVFRQTAVRPQYKNIMKIVLISSLLALSVQFGYSQQNVNEILRISLPDQEVRKAYLYNTESFNTDTIIIQNGVLKHSEEIHGTSVYHLMIEGVNDWSSPFIYVLSSEKTSLKFDELNPVREKKIKYYINRNQPVFVSDPNNNEVFSVFIDEWNTYLDSLQIIPPSNDQKDTVMVVKKDMYFSLMASSSTMITENKNRLVSAVIVNYLLNAGLLSLDKAQQFLKLISSEVKENTYAQNLIAEVGFEPGEKAPFFAMPDINGKTYNLESSKGIKVLLHFWSATCGPCIKESPKLVDLQKKYSKKDLLVVNVSLDTQKEHWVTGIDKAGLGGMINLCDFKGFNSQIVNSYKIKLIPSYYLIDETGNVIIKGSLDRILAIL